MIQYLIFVFAVLWIRLNQNKIFDPVRFWLGEIFKTIPNNNFGEQKVYPSFFTKF